MIPNFRRTISSCLQEILGFTISRLGEFEPKFPEEILVEEVLPENFLVRPFLTRKFFQEILGLKGSKHFLGKFRQVHILEMISDGLLRSKSFFQENTPGFICSVFRSA